MGDGVLGAIPGLLATAILVDAAGNVLKTTSKPLRQKPRPTLHPMRINPNPVDPFRVRKNPPRKQSTERRSSYNMYNVPGIIH